MTMDIDKDPSDDEADNEGLLIHPESLLTPVAPTPAGTLLPSPIASAVSFATRSTSFALRIGTVIGGYGLGAAKVTTLSSLELGRGILEGILSRAGRDVLTASDSDLARADAESILEKSLESLHRTMSQIVFWTATGFHVTGTTVSAASQISQLFLSVLDQFFGSTDSSRAIASIITLARREFRNPATGVQGERVGAVDLLLGVSGLAYLQVWCRRMIQEESRRLGYEEVIWDVVVLNDGERIDTPHSGLRSTSADSPEVDDLISAIESHGARQDSIGDEEDLEIQLRQQIVKSLPKNAQVSISTSTTTTKTITVDIKGASRLSVPSLPGLNLVESEVCSQPEEPTSSPKQHPNYRVVYKVSRNKVKTTPHDPTHDDDDDDDARSHVEELDDDVEQVHTPQSPVADKPPPLPSRLTRPTIASQARDRSHQVCDGALITRRSGSRSSSGSNDSMSPTNIGSLPKEHEANQKRTRKPLDGSRRNSSGIPVPVNPITAKPLEKRPDEKSDLAVLQAEEKRSKLRGVLRKPSVPTFSSFLSRESSSDTLANPKSKPSNKPPWGSYKPFHNKALGSVVAAETSVSLKRSPEAPRAPQRGNPNYFSSRDLGYPASQRKPGPFQHAYTTSQDRRRNSLVSLTDTFSVHSYESRPTTPIPQTNDTRGSNDLSPKSRAPNGRLDTPKSHQRSVSRASTHAPSIYTLKTKDSQTSLAVSSFHPKSLYSDSNALDCLRNSGGVSGIFPNFHLLRNITRYSRYASAVYGSNFLKLMGISKEQPALDVTDERHHDVRSFAHHTKLPPDSILLSSFVDPQGGSDSTGSTDTGIPLIHTVALDEESKAVVLTCRGTLGFEDVLADMMCDYDDLVWRGKTYQVHKGIHASARRLLYGGDGRVLYTIKAALEEYPQYGLVLCGHSLGGGVTALLGAMLAEPDNAGTSFVTSAQQHHRFLTDGSVSDDPAHVCLPSGRPIHVYTYGPPATMSPSLQKATRGLITSTVHGNDIVPYLSLGVLHDLQALALAFRSDNNEAKAEVRRRVWEGLRSGLADKWYNDNTRQIDEENDAWAYAALKTLRASMMSSKLLPPGEVFTIESTPVMRRDASSAQQIGKPATRLILKYVRDVEIRFREVRFGSSMLLDHSPGRYEDALRRLTMGVVET